MAGTNIPIQADPCPYVGPHPFKEGQRIYGRTREISELFYRLHSERILLLYSPSGAGKSSVIQAGLIPRLRESFDTWRPTRVNTPPPEALAGKCNRYTFSMMQGLEEGVPKGLRRPVEEYAQTRLADYVRDRPRHPEAPSNVFLFIDQFEEVLTYEPLNVDAKLEFFKQLGELLRVPNIWALMALREDYLAAFDPYAHLLPTHLKNRFRLDRLLREAAIEAIEGPTECTNRKYVGNTAGKLAHDLAMVKIQKADGDFLDDQEGLYVEPVQLQVVCQELWEQMPADDLEIDPVDVERFGNVSSALANYYNHQLQSIAGKDKVLERKIRDWIGTRLLTASGIRNQVIMGKHSTEGLDNSLIESLVRTHLLRPEVRGNATWFELAHDRLIRPVRESNAHWLERNLNKLQTDAALWHLQDRRNDALLLTGENLVQAQQWAIENPGAILDVESAFIEKSIARQKQLDAEAALIREKLAQARRARIRAALFGVIALVAVIVGVYAFDQKAAAEANERIARENLKRLFLEKAKIALQAVESRGWATDYQQAWLYQLAVLNYSSDLEPEVAGRFLQNHLLPDYKKSPDFGSRKITGQHENESIFRAAYAPGTSNWTYATTPVDGGYSDLICPAGTENGCLKESLRNVRALAVHPDRKHIAVRYRDKGLVEWIEIGRSTGSKQVTWQPKPGEPGGDGALSLKDDLLAVGTTSGQLVVLKASEQKLTMHAASPSTAGSKPITAVVWQLGKEAMLAAAREDGTLELFRYADGKLALERVVDDKSIKNISIANALAFWPESSLLVSGHGDGYIRVWDYVAGKLVASLRLHDASILALSIDPGGDRLWSISRDGVERTTILKPEIFDKTRELKSLLMVSGKSFRAQLYYDSRKELGYETDKEEPTPGKEASTLALKHFDLTRLLPFSDDKSQLRIVRSDIPGNLSVDYPAESADGVITLMPDQIQAARSAVFLKDEIRNSFKVEFEYRIFAKQATTRWEKGDFLAFQFFKDFQQPAAGHAETIYDKRGSSGYSLQFNVYPYVDTKTRVEDPAQIRLYDLNSQGGEEWLHKEKLDQDELYTGQSWHKVCIEVNMKPGKALCKPDEQGLQGVHVYLNGARRFSYNKELVASHGRMGFTAYSGLAVSEKLLRNVVVTPSSDEAQSHKISLRRENISTWRWESPLRQAARQQAEQFPKVAMETLHLTPSEPHWRANSVLIDNNFTDYSVEFEYSIYNHSSADPEKTGQGIVFLFGKDAKRYSDKLAPDADVNAFQEDSGCGIHFAVYQTRSILLKGSCLEDPGKPVKAKLIHGLPDVYTDGMDGLNEWRTARVEVRHSEGRVQLFFEGAKVLDKSVKLESHARAFGFGSPTPNQFKIEASAEHKVRNVVVRDLAKKSELP